MLWPKQVFGPVHFCNPCPSFSFHLLLSSSLPFSSSPLITLHRRLVKTLHRCSMKNILSMVGEQVSIDNWRKCFYRLLAKRFLSMVREIVSIDDQQKFLYRRLEKMSLSMINKKFSIDDQQKSQKTHLDLVKNPTGYLHTCFLDSL